MPEKASLIFSAEKALSWRENTFEANKAMK